MNSTHAPRVFVVALPNMVTSGHNLSMNPNTVRRRTAGSSRGPPSSADQHNEQSAPPGLRGRHGSASNNNAKHAKRYEYIIGDTVRRHRSTLFILVMLSIGLLYLFTRLLLLPAIWSQNTTSTNGSSTLEFGPVTFAGYNNWVYRDNITAAQVLLSE